ncbi:hypothetical protein [Larkinella sp.]|uniref:hypothetical protein n=1 Tax=Larkinella sp. TaxID=2034517 RepID=UPI003BA87D47
MIGFNLEPVRELVKIADADYMSHARPNALHHRSGSHVDSETFVRLIRTILQGKELVGLFDEFRQECEDFVSGNLQMYIDDYRMKHPDGRKEFDPFSDMFDRFVPDHNYSFVKDIGQFSELVQLAAASESEELRHCLEGYNAFIAQWYEIIHRYHASSFSPDYRACAAEFLTYYRPRHADAV